MRDIDVEKPVAAVLGEGSMGTALAHVVASRRRTCRLWCRDEAIAREINDRHRHPKFFAGTALAPDLVAVTRLEEAVSGASAIIVAVPSASFAEIARALGQILTSAAPLGPPELLLSSTKGFDPASNKLMSQLLREHARAQAFGAIAGPNITPDIMANRLTAIQVAASTPAGVDLATRLLSTSSVRVYGSDDLASVELVAALKNVAAIATGIAIGMNLAINTVSFVITRAFDEVRRLAIALGARSEPFLDLAGLGDLFLTATHPSSLNRQVGIGLGEGKRLSAILDGLGEVPEGINTVRAHVELARLHGVEAPLANGIYEIMKGTLAPSALERLVCETSTENRRS